MADICGIYPREIRRDIERRWGFTALVDAVSKQDGVFGPTARILLHGYSIASDLQHMSHVGTELSLERDTRSEQRRDAIELAHAARLLGDCFHFTFLRVLVLLRFLEHRWDQLLEVEAKHVPLIKELKQAGREWEAIEYPICPATTG